VFKRNTNRVFYTVKDSYIKMWFNENDLFAVISSDGQSITTNTTYHPKYYDLVNDLASFVENVNHLSLRSLLPTWFKQHGFTAIEVSKDRG
jgi:hypothetical protein